jgi:hypothetical protein
MRVQVSHHLTEQYCSQKIIYAPGWNSELRFRAVGLCHDVKDMPNTWLNMCLLECLTNPNWNYAKQSDNLPCVITGYTIRNEIPTTTVFRDNPVCCESVTPAKTARYRTCSLRKDTSCPEMFPVGLLLYNLIIRVRIAKCFTSRSKREVMFVNEHIFFS